MTNQNCVWGEIEKQNHVQQQQLSNTLVVPVSLLTTKTQLHKQNHNSETCIATSMQDYGFF